VTVRLRDVVSFLDDTLAVGQFRDYGVNGLQVEGAPEVEPADAGSWAWTSADIVAGRRGEGKRGMQ